MSSKDGKQYRKKDSAVIMAVQLNLDTPGFIYEKWGGEQRCKSGDWLVDNQGDCYTIDQQTFADTYTPLSPGVYQKTQAVWAEVASKAGTVTTKEGSTDFKAGDYIVYNNADGSDAYAINKVTLEETYDLVDD
jgi:hypothetical protein